MADKFAAVHMMMHLARPQLLSELCSTELQARLVVHSVVAGTGRLKVVIGPDSWQLHATQPAGVRVAAAAPESNIPGSYLKKTKSEYE